MGLWATREVPARASQGARHRAEAAFTALYFADAKHASAGRRRGGGNSSGMRAEGAAGAARCAAPPQENRRWQASGRARHVGPIGWRAVIGQGAAAGRSPPCAAALTADIRDH